MKKRDTTVLVKSNGPTSIFVAGKREEDVFFERRENTKEKKNRTANCGKFAYIRGSYCIHKRKVWRRG